MNIKLTILQIKILQMASWTRDKTEDNGRNNLIWREQRKKLKQKKKKEMWAQKKANKRT